MGQLGIGVRIDQERVVGVGVKVNEAGGNDLPRGVDFTGGIAYYLTNGYYRVAFDRHIRLESGRSSSIDHRSVLDYEIEQASSPDSVRNL